VVGAGNETDRELLETTWRLAAEIGLARTFFSGFQPVPDTPLEGREADPGGPRTPALPGGVPACAPTASHSTRSSSMTMTCCSTERDPKMMAALAREG
jgi:hypothetical protein